MLAAHKGSTGRSNRPSVEPAATRNTCCCASSSCQRGLLPHRHRFPAVQGPRTGQVRLGRVRSCRRWQHHDGTSACRGHNEPEDSPGQPGPTLPSSMVTYYRGAPTAGLTRKPGASTLDGDCHRKRQPRRRDRQRTALGTKGKATCFCSSSRRPHRPSPCVNMVWQILYQSGFC